MTRLITLANRLFAWSDHSVAPWVLPSLARLTFAATLLTYFWHSAALKTGPGLFGVFQPSLGAYAQIFPKAMEAAGYNTDALGLFHTLVVIAGTLAEFLLPALIVLGLATRVAAFGMIGFVVVQTLTDLYGHGALAQAKTLGAWFDRVPDSVIMDQRLFWLMLLAIPALLGAGPLSLDRLLRR
ncbi:MAG: DoxX family protein [Rhodobacteraceae bacterium]|nr:DoxX family protein [Paracoccaceae bacterium]